MRAALAHTREGEFFGDTHVVACFHSFYSCSTFRMSQLLSVPMDKWKMAILKFDRPFLLRTLGLDVGTQIVGDVYKLRSLQQDSVNTWKVHKVHVPFLQCGAQACCEGAILHRSNRTTVGVPCLATQLRTNSKLCKHCEQLWTKLWSII